MKKLKKIIGVICFALAVFCLIFAGTNSVQAKSQPKPKPYQFEFDKETGTLTVTGKGKVKLSEKEYDRLTEYDDDTYTRRYKIKKLVIEEGITAIGDYAFSTLYSLKSVELPGSLKSIGRGAFESTKIEKIIIPKSVRIIDEEAFAYCRYLEKIDFEKGSELDTIGSSAFSGTAIVEIKIPSGTYSVGRNCFYYCKNLEKAEINSNSIEANTFMGCEKLKDVDLGDKIRVIDIYAFESCKALTKITLPDGLAIIGKNAFAKSGLSKIVIPDSVNEIGKYAFCTCKSLEMVKLPNQLTEIKRETFRGCAALDTIYFGSCIQHIKESAFEGCKLTNLTIPASVKTMDYKAFYDCEIEELYISEGVTYIGDWNFAENKKIKTVNIPSTVALIEENAFSGCERTEAFNVDINNTEYMSYNGILLTKDGEKLFACPATAGVVVIPASVKRFSEYAFSGCTRVTEFQVESGNTTLTSINGILYSADGTCLVKYPQGITGVAVVPNTTISIANNAFSGCAVSEIKIPYSVVELGAGCFEECGNLTKIVIPGSVRVIPVAAFWGDDKLKEVKLESGVELIRRNAFYGCTSLKKVRLANSVKSINATAFSDCGYKLTFYCSKKSAALVFAEKNGIRYKLV